MISLESEQKLAVEEAQRILFGKLQKYNPRKELTQLITNVRIPLLEIIAIACLIGSSYLGPRNTPVKNIPNNKPSQIIDESPNRFPSSQP